MHDDNVNIAIHILILSKCVYYFCHRNQKENRSQLFGTLYVDHS